MTPQAESATQQSFLALVGKGLVAASAMVFLAMSLTTGFLRGSDDWQSRERLARIACALIAAALVSLLFYGRRENLGAKEDPAEDHVAFPAPRWIDRTIAEAAQRLKREDRQPVATFVELLTKPVDHRVRVVETIDLDGRSMAQRVTVEFDLPPRGPDAGDFLYIPLLHPLKGELLDNFHLRDAENNSLADLTYEETTQLAAAGLRLLLAHDLTEAVDGEHASAGLVPDTASTVDSTAEKWPSSSVQAAERDLLRLLATRGNLEPEAARIQIHEILEELTLATKTIRQIRNYVVALCAAYPIVAVIDPSRVTGNRLLLKYERAYTPASFSADVGMLDEPTKANRFLSKLKQWRGLVRIGLGLRPSQVGVGVDLALTTASYHLRLNAPESKYVFKQSLVCRHCHQLVTEQWIGSNTHPGPTPFCRHDRDPVSVSRQVYKDRHYFRLQRRRGQNFAHLYMRGFGKTEPPMDGLGLVVRFKEVPPGSRAQAAVTALVTTALIMVIGYLISQDRVSPESDYPAVVLALPAVVASWFGLSSERNLLVGGSLLARVSLIVTGIVSVTSMITYLMTAPTDGDSMTRDSHDGWTLLGITHPYWVILALISLANCMYIYYRFGLKLVHYGDLLRRKHDRWSTASAD